MRLYLIFDETLVSDSNKHPKVGVVIPEDKNTVKFVYICILFILVMAADA
jgi:hypothetical protein